MDPPTRRGEICRNRFGSRSNVDNGAAKIGVCAEMKGRLRKEIFDVFLSIASPSGRARAVVGDRHWNRLVPKIYSYELSLAHFALLCALCGAVADRDASAPRSGKGRKVIISNPLPQ